MRVRVMGKQHVSKDRHTMENRPSLALNNVDPCCLLFLEWLWNYQKLSAVLPMMEAIHFSSTTYLHSFSLPWESSGFLFLLEESLLLHAVVFQKICVGSGPSLISSVQFSCSVVSNSLWPHDLQQARPPCPSQAPGVYSSSYPSSWWCHPTMSSSVIPFSSCPQSLPASGSFPMSQLFAWGGQSTGVSVSASVLPVNTQDWSPLGWTGWISLQSKGLWRVFSNTTVQKHQLFGAQLSL